MEKPFLFVALDYKDINDVVEKAQELTRVRRNNFGFKLNLDLFIKSAFDEGANWLDSIARLSRPVFADLKMWNGARTMENIVGELSSSPFLLDTRIVNMYPHAGKKFFGRVAQKLKDTNTQLFGLTVLTHYTDEDTQRIYGKNLRESIRMLAQMDFKYGAQGLILPAPALDVVHDIDLPKLCPGIRPSWYQDRKGNYQEQTSTPKEAIEKGANYLVVGSPITKSDNPVEALERVLDEMS